MNIMDMPKFMDKNEEYDYYHCICPVCLGDEFEEVNKPIPFSESRKNANKYKCKNCNWLGYQHQFLAKNLEDNKKIV
jgi:hypothetical protein